MYGERASPDDEALNENDGSERRDLGAPTHFTITTSASVLIASLAPHFRIGLFAS
jgi:hypothetical protein